jgi:hypothetical protein
VLATPGHLRNLGAEKLDVSLQRLLEVVLHRQRRYSPELPKDWRHFLLAPGSTRPEGVRRSGFVPLQL